MRDDSYERIVLMLLLALSYCVTIAAVATVLIEGCA